MRNGLKKLLDSISDMLGNKRSTSMKALLWKMVLIIIIPLTIIIMTIVVLEIWYTSEYKSILNNVTMASEFNQNFKDDVDLKMYYYVINSQYSEGLPVDEVRSAKELAETLLSTTTEANSIRAITSVSELCDTLEDKIFEIDRCTSYDERQEQLENNIYIISELISDYMYTYLYYEAAHLNTVQSAMQNRMTLALGLIFAITACITIVLLLLANRIGKSITDPIGELCQRVDAIRKEGTLDEQAPIQANQIEIQTLSDGFERMIRKLSELMEKNRLQEKQRRNAELALLQAQINPHFLYNTLDTIIWLTEAGKYTDSINMVDSLSGFFRNSLSNGMDVITLREEENQVRCYLEIQQMRYRDRLIYDIDIADELKNCELPKLTLQPLVENALYHGIKLKRWEGGEKGHINVVGRLSGEFIILKITDNGAGMTSNRLDVIRKSLNAQSEADQVGFGLRTVHQRLQLHFGEEYGLSVESRPDLGTTVTATIPIQYRGERSENQ